MENEAAKVIGAVWCLQGDIEDIIDWNNQQGDFDTLEKHTTNAHKNAEKVETKVKIAASQVSTLLMCIQSLINKVNVVTCEYIHQKTVSSKAMEALCARQIEVEEKMRNWKAVKPTVKEMLGDRGQK
jgi:FtsZ-binding cell division protein ZapB